MRDNRYLTDTTGKSISMTSSVEHVVTSCYGDRKKHHANMISHGDMMVCSIADVANATAKQLIVTFAPHARNIKLQHALSPSLHISGAIMIQYQQRYGDS